MKRFIKCAAWLIAMLLALTSCASPVSMPLDTLPVDTFPVHNWTKVTGTKPVTITHGSWQMVLDPASGDFTVTDTATGEMWHSNPPGRAESAGVTGLGKLQLNSQILISVYSDKNSNENVFASSNACVSKKGLTVSVDGNSIRCDYRFEKEGISVPLVYTLNDNGLEAAVLTGEIEETSDKMLASVSVLPYFAAVAPNEEGWLLVPDGSGALLKLTEGTDAYGSLLYKKYVYGVDPLLSLKQATTKTEDILIPAFGSRNGGQGVLGLVVSGDAVTNLQINGEGNKSGYSSIYPSVMYRESDTLTLYAGTGQEKTTFAYEDRPISLPAWRVQYFFCKDADYADMAKRVASYYRNLWKLDQRDSAQEGIYIHALGGVEQIAHVMGMPVDKVYAATTYDQVAEWLDILGKEGVNQLTLLYDGLFDGGIKNAYPVDGSFDSALGSDDQREALFAKAKNGVTIVPVADLSRIYLGAGGVEKDAHSARGVKGANVELYPLQYSTGTPLQTVDSYALLSPSLLPDVYSRFATALLEQGVTALCDNGLSQLSADYRRPSQEGDVIRVDRQQAMLYQQKALTDALGEDLAWYSSTGYAYMLPYLTGITSLPVKSSRYIGMEDIPFAQLVFGQFTEYAAPIINTYPDHNEYLLKMLEYGALPSISLMNAERIEINAAGIEITAGTFADWKDIVVELADVAREIYGKLDGVMVGHTICADGVYRSDYSGGGAIYVNYTDASVTVDGVTVPAGSYFVHGG